jgi:hypothetical protein
MEYQTNRPVFQQCQLYVLASPYFKMLWAARLLYGEKLTSHTKVHSTEKIYTSRRNKLLRLTANMNYNRMLYGVENNLTPDRNTIWIEMQLWCVLWLSKPHVQHGLQIPGESGYQPSVFTAILFPAGKQYDVRINQNINTTV